jgi:hypothetical protein
VPQSPLNTDVRTNSLCTMSCDVSFYVLETKYINSQGARIVMSRVCLTADLARSATCGLLKAQLQNWACSGIWWPHVSLGDGGHYCTIWYHRILLTYLIQRARSPNSSVGIASSYRLEGRGIGVGFLARQEILSSPQRQDRLWGHPASWLMSTGVCFPGNKAAVAWSCPLALFDAEVKNTCSHTSTSSTFSWRDV